MFSLRYSNLFLIKKSLGSNFAALSKNDIRGKIKHFFRLAEVNGALDDENTNFDAKFTLIDRGEPGSYTRVETEFKLTNNVNPVDEDGNPFKLTYEHLKGWKIRGIPLVETKQFVITNEGDVFFKMKVLSFVITHVEENTGEADQSMTQERLAGEVNAVSLTDAIKNMIVAKNRRAQSEIKESENRLKFSVADNAKPELQNDKVKENSPSKEKSFPKREEQTEEA